MFGNDTKYLDSSPPITVCFLFSLVSLFLITPFNSLESSQEEDTRAEGFKHPPTNIKEERTFKLTDTFQIGPIEEDTNKLRAWLEVPLETKLQNVEHLSVTTDIPSNKTTVKITTDPVLKNRFLYLEVENPQAKSITVTINSQVTRFSLKGAYEDSLTDAQKKHHLKGTGNVPVGDEMKKLAHENGATEDNNESLKAIYDFVVDNSTYYKANPDKFTSSGPDNLDANFCLYQKQGGCTDFHALYMAMSRSIDLPSRFSIGSFLPEAFEGKDRDVAYHCWAEGYLGGNRWLPLDAAYGDLWPSRREYYYGNLDARRVLFSRGRGIKLIPEPDDKKTLPYFIKGYVEVNGKEFKNWTRKLTFTEMK